MTNKTKRAGVAAIGVVSGFTALYTLSCILDIGASLRHVHPLVQYAFVAAALGTVYWFAVRPLIAHFHAPVLSVSEVLSDVPIDDRKLEAIARQLLRSPGLDQNVRDDLGYALRSGKSLREPLRAILAVRSAQLERLIISNATTVFMSTALSQNGKLDGLIVLVTNIRMVAAMTQMLGLRPSITRTIRLHIQILVTSFLSQQIEDLDIPETLSAMIGVNVLAAVPFVGRVLDCVLRSTVDGLMNALLTARIGYVARTYLLNGGEVTDRKVACREARVCAFTTIMPLAKDLTRRAEEMAEERCGPWISRGASAEATSPDSA